MKRDQQEKMELRSYEFTDYKFRSEASKKVRRRLRRYIKRSLRGQWKREVRREQYA
jgi:hypothetical protein